ncbi:hypothetical protein DFP72DRAFT_1173037 [Ephemerocybe angulata]|uniref:Uncharacterized protein n=1 Tax=Ephemerocybe angulata TaxID=980116 RepID=A0A8H6M1U9_9AGAR|nr:hypothetical protein DFP72DRAFT_1173037 [Tulosesus angulatus]
MKFTLAPLVSLLFGASYLIANAAAYSYDDYNELDARYQIDDVLSERGFGLAARETVDVPFQPSLRAFLDEAVTAHRRSMSEYEHLEAREMISVTGRVKVSDNRKKDIEITYNVDPAQMRLVEFMWMMENGTPENFRKDQVPKDTHLVLYKPFLKDKPLVGDWKTLKDLEVKNGDTIVYRFLIPKP